MFSSKHIIHCISIDFHHFSEIIKENQNLENFYDKKINLKKEFNTIINEKTTSITEIKFQSNARRA